MCYCLSASSPRAGRSTWDNTHSSLSLSKVSVQLSVTEIFFSLCIHVERKPVKLPEFLQKRGYQSYFWHMVCILKRCLDHTQPIGFTSVLSYLYHCFRCDLVFCLGLISYSSLFLPPQAQHYPYRFLRDSILSVPRKENRTCGVYLSLPLPNSYRSMSTQMISTGMGHGTITSLSR